MAKKNKKQNKSKKGMKADGSLASAPESGWEGTPKGIASTMVWALVVASGAAAYLLYAYIQKHLDPNYESICAISATFDCDKLNTSDWGKIFGIPITVFAIPTYAALVGLVLRSRTADAVGRGALSLVMGVSALATVYGGFLFYIMVDHHQVYCPFCLTMDAMALLVLVLAFVAYRPGAGPDADLITPLKKAVLVGLAVFVVPLGVHLSSVSSYEDAKKAEANVGVDLNEPAPAVALGAAGDAGTKARKLDAKNYFIPIQEDDAVFGPPDAKVTIVEFADFQCGYCKKLFYALKPMKEKYKNDSVRFVFKHFPMGTSCNSTIKNNRHRYACDASFAAECARQQDRFWPMHDILFKNQHKLKKSDLMYYANEVGLNIDDYRRCMASPSPRLAVKSDVQTYDETGIAKGTPRTFVNGRFFKGVLPQSTLEHLIEQELGRKAPGERPQVKAPVAPTSVKPATAPSQVKVDYGRPFWIDSFEGSIDSSGKALSAFGVEPANATWYEAKAACEQAGKRLCTTEEWVSACQSAAAVDDDLSGSFADDYVEGNQFPYADWHEARWCRDSQVQQRGPDGAVIREGTAGKTGDRPRCATPAGVFDLGGNVAEWAGADENLAVLLGGDYRSKDKAACFRPNSTFGPGHKNDRIGFRCCSDSRVETKGKAVAKKAPSTLIGQRLPSFTGDLLEGGTLESGSLGGEVVYLSFFASWCSPCKRELPALNELQKKYADRGLRVIGVGVDTDPAKSERMARQLGVEYPVILDPRGKILGLFDVKSMPTTYLVGRNGTIVEKLVGWGETAEKLPKVMQRVEEEL
jgi:protein-disulfide isomerase/thiol-disulfide isomerase/thioredoxin/uncharacterized membrane protein